VGLVAEYPVNSAAAQRRRDSANPGATRPDSDKSVQKFRDRIEFSEFLE
jgi:hypothetical protein